MAALDELGAIELAALELGAIELTGVELGAAELVAGVLDLLVDDAAAPQRLPVTVATLALPVP